MIDFVISALTFIALGICILIIVLNSKKSRKNNDYLIEGMAIGMCLGVSLSTSLDFDLGLGISLGMLVGELVGFMIKR